MRILGLDLGSRRIGLALSAPGGTMALSLGVIPRTHSERDLAAIASLAREEGVERIVVGLPLSLDSSLGEEAQRALAFREELARYTGLPVDTWDERLTTVAAEKALLQAGVKRAKRRQARDALAATFILQTYLDSRQRPGPSPEGGAL